MREIKFRAWDILKQRWSNYKINDGTVYFMDKNTGVWYGTYNRRYKDFNLMQYTGLKDKNNKEIYEGDIVKFEDCSIDGTREFYNIGVIEREGKRDELVISQLLFEKTYFTENYMDFIDQTFEVSEIVGNIYENPELLGGQ